MLVSVLFILSDRELWENQSVSSVRQLKITVEYSLSHSKWEKKYKFVDRRQRDGSGCKDICEIWILWVTYN